MKKQGKVRHYGLQMKVVKDVLANEGEPSIKVREELKKSEIIAKVFLEMYKSGTKGIRIQEKKPLPGKFSRYDVIQKLEKLKFVEPDKRRKKYKISKKGSKIFKREIEKARKTSELISS